jgi:hypothetical protein
MDIICTYLGHITIPLFIQVQTWIRRTAIIVEQNVPSISVALNALSGY